MKTKLAYYFSFLEYKSDLTSFMIYSVILFLKTTIKLPTQKNLNTYISARIFTLDLVDFVQNFRGIINVLFPWFSQSSLSCLEKIRNCSKFRLVQGHTILGGEFLLHVEVEDLVVDNCCSACKSFYCNSFVAAPTLWD